MQTTMKQVMGGIALTLSLFTASCGSQTSNGDAPAPAVVKGSSAIGNKRTNATFGGDKPFLVQNFQALANCVPADGKAFYKRMFAFQCRPFDKRAGPNFDFQHISDFD